MEHAQVVAVHRDAEHRFSKPTVPRIELLGIGETIVEVTGLRNPCRQIDDFDPGLLRLVVDRAPDGTVVRRSGVMAVVRRGGWVGPGDPIEVTRPQRPHQPLAPV